MHQLGLALLAMLISAALSCPALAATETARRPNVLVILSDDQGWGDLGVSGNADLSTPNIDSIARNGATLVRFYVCPVCSPTRAEFLTGRYHLRSGVHSTSSGGERMDLDERTIAEAFANAGYATGCFGKWHNGMQYPYHPRARGFDEFFGFCSGHWGQYFNAEFEHNGAYVKTEGYCADVFTDRAIRFIEKNKDRPFFCYLPLCTPHSPMQVPDEYWNRFAKVRLEMEYGDTGTHTRAALAMCENIDANVGRLLSKLDEFGIADDTIVIYFSDNGPNGPRWNGSMKGRKGSTDEGGVRSPCFVRYPRKIEEGRKVFPITGAIDLLPTLVDLAGIERVGDKPLDGMNITPLLNGEKVSWPDRLIFSHWNGRISVRRHDYRLDHAGKLYNMIEDPSQTIDVTQKHPEVARLLGNAVKVWRAEMQAEPGGDGPFTVGHADWPITELPARDAVPSASIEPSSRHPNCSYLRNWKSADDRISWKVQVLTAGRYEAIIEYTCAEADVGATVELDFNGAKVRGKITEANNPPAVGASNDRDPRSESYVKEFRPLLLGVIELPQSDGEMTLQAIDVPGEQVGELRRLRLVRVTGD